MKKKKYDIDRSDIDRSLLLSKLRESFLLSIIAGIVALVPALFSVFFIGGTFAPGHLLAAISVIVGTIFLIVGFTFILSRRERGSSYLAKLKNDLTSACLNALEQSTLNPAKGKQP
uniref:Uncharacterized protein n=2 Tax=unclassified Candidatus Kentrum TaxID=2643149 RepID=A0A451AHK2_9GAMM|nr:MAG: hypothetical protein BECKLPF1236B_GA0070989_109511 [Candidatus Kentron sp. LPFa]VFK65495.1 MAG: hypothetical protein BECKUNK1418G_GA0071005_10646 [Candidatus Kentron sp. UNK]VFK71455.1 MAG: hypothetical protein BECKUNK1418H_GA0071006_10676 [Candidatus Kentron sp. UNK]